MIKLVTLLKRRPPLDRPAFETRWLTVHAPMAAVFPGLRGYMLGFPVDPQSAEPSADGVAQLWFDTEEAAQASYATDIGRSGSKDASGNLTRREHLFVSEQWIRPAGFLAGLPFKLLVAGKRRAGVARETFAADWEQSARELAAIFPDHGVRACVDRRGKMLSSASEGPLTLRDAEPPHDGLIEIWCRTFEDLQSLQGQQGVVERVIEVHVASKEILGLREHVVVMPPGPAYGMEG